MFDGKIMELVGLTTGYIPKKHRRFAIESDGDHHSYFVGGSWIYQKSIEFRALKNRSTSRFDSQRGTVQRISWKFPGCPLL
jgi:hypothetical protein